MPPADMKFHFVPALPVYDEGIYFKDLHFFCVVLATIHVKNALYMITGYGILFCIKYEYERNQTTLSRKSTICNYVTEFSCG